MNYPIIYWKFEMDVFVGIDPSLNSTGLCFLYYDGDKKIKEYFAITKPDKLTKKEKLAQEKYLFFDYFIYPKIDLKNIEDNNVKEYNKTINYLTNANEIKNIIKENTKSTDNVYFVQEAVSYGSSMRTKSVFDLAGLNFVLRYILSNLQSRFYHYNIKMAFIPPTQIKKFASGSGNCNKETMVNTFKLLYPDFDLPKIDDICDAYYMALYAKYLKDTNSEIYEN